MVDTAKVQPSLATYREVRFEGKRFFELGEYSVHVTGSTTFLGSFDVTIPLSAMMPITNRLRLRGKAFGTGTWLLAAGFIGYAILVSGFKLDPIALGTIMVLVVGISGALLCCVTWRTIEIVQFVSDTGAPILEIARSGPECEHFEHFVHKVQQQVLHVRERSPGETT